MVHVGSGASEGIIQEVSDFHIDFFEYLTCKLSNDYEPSSWSDGAWLFPRAIRLLGVPEYRHDILSGILLSLSSKTDSTVSGTPS